MQGPTDHRGSPRPSRPLCPCSSPQGPLRCRPRSVVSALPATTSLGSGSRPCWPLRLPPAPGLAGPRPRPASLQPPQRLCRTWAFVQAPLLLPHLPASTQPSLARPCSFHRLLSAHSLPEPPPWGHRETTEAGMGALATGLWSLLMCTDRAWRPGPGRAIRTPRLSDPGSHTLPKGEKMLGVGAAPPRAPQQPSALCPFSGSPGRRAPPPLQQASPPPRLSCLTPSQISSSNLSPQNSCHSPDSTTRVPHPSLAYPSCPPGVPGSCSSHKHRGNAMQPSIQPRGLVFP